MAHKHTCMECSEIIESGEFDCDDDCDHDFGRCDRCQNELVEEERE